MNPKTIASLSLLLLAALILMTQPAQASIVKIGNGDDGGDLEGGTKVSSGILLETRTKAVERLRSLNVQSTEHLGMLIPELEKSEIYLVNRNLAPKLDEDKGPEGSPDGKSVYARTFAEPHAATRFFPAALMLNEDQLISLHIHEALHRALPPSVRESEEIVSKITLAIAAPDASIDRIRKVVASEVPANNALSSANGSVLNTNGPVTIVVNNGGANISSQTRLSVPEPEIDQPSSITYSYRSFFIPKKEKSSYPIESMHSMQSFLYPFGTGNHAFGVGIEASYLTTPEQALMGPLNLSARLRLATMRGFDIGLWGAIALNTIADDELKESPLGRDLTTVGLSFRRDAPRYYIENLVSYGSKGEAKQKISKVEYTHEFGATTAASVRFGGKLANFEIGGFTEVLLSDAYKVHGGAFEFDSGRYRIISAGPELAYIKDAFKFTLGARWVLDSTRGVSLDYLGDLLGHGVGQGSVTTSASFRF